MSQTALHAPTDEAESVLAWRELTLSDCGIEPETAAKLAASKGDLHEMVAAAQGGASGELLLRIFI